MTMLKRFWFLPLVLTLSCASASAWWQNFLKDPVAQIQVFEQDVNTILTDVQAAWVLVSPLLGGQQAAATDAYNKAVSDVGHTMGILSDAVQAAVDAKTTPAPDFTAMTAAVTDALQQLVSIVDSFQPPASVVLARMAGAPPHMGAGLNPLLPNPALDEAKVRLAALKSRPLGHAK